ncbi:MAG: ABC transporter permease, partial [Acidimicrobiia bacterium]|nr:ABC transporter permease [Acidimicrobiia bacterium]
MNTVALTVGHSAPVRTGAAHWVQSYLMMTRWELGSLRLLLPLIIALQIVIGGGFALGIGLFFDEMPARNALFLATGVGVVTLITVGLVLGPQLVGNHKVAGTYDFLWSLPVPRTTQAAAWLTVNSIIALPGMVAALVIADWRYDLTFEVSWVIVPAVLLTITTATLVGYAFAHAIPKPMITQMITQLLIFMILGFSPINFPPENLPGWLVSVNQWLPFQHMAAVIRAALTDGLVDNVGTSYLILTVYTLASAVVAAWVIG